MKAAALNATMSNTATEVVATTAYGGNEKKRKAGEIEPVEVVGPYGLITSTAHGLGVSGTQRPVDAALVVGVDLGLGGVGRLGPAVNLGLDPFHRQVGALDQADLDLGPSRCTA